MPRYPTPENVEIRPQARTFILFALTLAYPMFGAGFELGAYGELRYEKSSQTRHLQEYGNILWHRHERTSGLLAAGFFSASGEDPVTRPLLFTLGLVSYLLCFPFAIYLVVKVVNPELLNLRGWKPKAGIVAIALLFIVAGYLVGGHNYLFLNCSDFEVAGSMPPDNCSL